MGYQEKKPSYALISMVNNDTYYIDEGTARLVMDLLEAEKGGFVKFNDTKSDRPVMVAVQAISSIVILGGQHA